MISEGRDLLSWRGGAIISNLSSFKYMWITKKVILTNKIGIRRGGRKDINEKIILKLK